MSEGSQSFSLESLASAAAAVEHFNAFHDAFVRRIEIVSFDEFADRDTQRCSARLDLTIRFAHWNYDFAAGARPYQQEVEATFHHVRDLSMGLRGLGEEWSVLRMVVAETSRVAAGAVGSHHARLRAELWQPRNDEDEWRDHCDLEFTFEGGKLRELPVHAA